MKHINDNNNNKKIKKVASRSNLLFLMVFNIIYFHKRRQNEMQQEPDFGTDISAVRSQDHIIEIGEYKDKLYEHY